MKLNCILIALLLVACDNLKSNDSIQQNESGIKSTKSAVHEDLFKKNVIVILSEAIDEKSNKINVQDYIQNGKSYVPVFTSIEKFNESTQGHVKNQKVEIKGMFLLSLLHGNETLRINPGLKDEENLQASELIKEYSSEIVELKEEMKKIK
jgi:hypothetical protein